MVRNENDQWFTRGNKRSRSSIQAQGAWVSLSRKLYSHDLRNGE